MLYIQLKRVLVAIIAVGFVLAAMVLVDSQTRDAVLAVLAGGVLSVILLETFIRQLARGESARLAKPTVFR